MALTPAPQWLIQSRGYHTDKPKDDTTPPVVDEGGAVTRALSYLAHDAPQAVEGAGGDSTTYTVAARLKDFGVAQSTAYLLLSTAWNHNNSPPWSESELKAKVRNAYQYGNNAPGSASPEADFGPVDTGDPFDTTPKAKPKLALAPAEPVDIASIPKRQWLLGRFLLRDKVTVLIAPPGAGKSTFSLAVALSIITGASAPTGLPVYERSNVLAINNEDDTDELHRRLAALQKRWGVTWPQIQGKLHLYSGVEHPFIIAKRTAEGNVSPVDMDQLVDYIVANEIGVLVIDPFLETHRVQENSNEEINQVGRFYREVAVRTGCAVLLVHHTRKLPAGSPDSHIGNMESGRGASSLTGVARIVATLYGMGKRDAEFYGVREDQRHLYVRLDDAKANLSLASPVARWFRKESITLANGDDVGVLGPADLQPVQAEWEGAALDQIALLLADSGEGQITMREAANGVLGNPVLDTGVSNDTMQRTLRALLADKREAGGWVMWYECDERVGGRGRSKHWVFGHVAEDSAST